MRGWKREDLGGKVNKMAILKVSVLVFWIVGGGMIGIYTELPAYPQAWLAKQWTLDMLEYMNNTTIWEELRPMTRSMYIVIPMFYSILILGWAVFIRKIRRKTLYVNGIKYGIVMFIHGYRKGHIYDIACLLNGGRHFKDLRDFPRPISGSFMDDQTVIYYRPGWFHSPTEWFRLLVTECIIYYYGVQVIVPMTGDGPIPVFTNRVTDPLRPYIVYSDLRYDSTLDTVDNDLKLLTVSHVQTQEQILRNTWRMARAEPGTAIAILRKSSYAIPDRTLGKFWEKLPPKDQDRIRGEWKHEQDTDW